MEKLAPRLASGTNKSFMDGKENDAADMESVFNKIPVCDGCDIAGINDWLNYDSNDPGFHILSDEEIIDDIRGTMKLLIKRN